MKQTVALNVRNAGYNLSRLQTGKKCASTERAHQND